MTIEERLESMEKEMGCQKRRNRWLLGTILFVVGGLIVPGVFEITAIRARSQEAGTANDQVGQKVKQFVAGLPSAQAPAQKEIRARSFILEDAKGKTRAVLDVEEFGPALSLWDEKGKIRAMLITSKEGPGLALFDEKGKTRANLSVFEDGPELSMYDENDKSRIGLIADKDGPGLVLRDENGKNRVVLSAFKDVGSLLSLLDENGKIRFTAGKIKTVMPDGKIIEYPESSLLLYGPDGKVIWSAIK